MCSVCECSEPLLCKYMRSCVRTVRATPTNVHSRRSRSTRERVYLIIYIIWRTRTVYVEVYLYVFYYTICRALRVVRAVATAHQTTPTLPPRNSPEFVCGRRSTLQRLCTGKESFTEFIYILLYNIYTTTAGRIYHICIDTYKHAPTATQRSVTQHIYTHMYKHTGCTLHTTQQRMHRIRFSYQVRGAYIPSIWCIWSAVVYACLYVYTNPYTIL